MTIPVSKDLQFFSDSFPILVEFANIHLDFFMSELISILNMHGLALGFDYKFVALPGDDFITPLSVSSSRKPSTRPFIILNIYTHILPKFDYLWNSFPGSDICVTTREKMECLLSKILSRCIMVRCVIELWGWNSMLGHMINNLKIDANKLNSRLDNLPTVSGNDFKCQSWKLTIRTLGFKFTSYEQDIIRNMFSFLCIPGFIEMKNPYYEFLLVLESEVTHQGIPFKHLIAVYFGKILQNSATRKNDWRHQGVINKFHLSKRSYLGPTSMDTELSFIIANLAQIQKGQSVFDPFVGTGSLLLACSMRGAYVFGTDIDIRALRGNNQKMRNIYSNFQQYGLLFPDIVRSDNSLYFSHFNHKYIEHGVYHAIISDPPYGIRAGARRSGSKSNKVSPILDYNRTNHKPQTKPYHIYDVMIDLLNLAARTLVPHGKLVYIIPSLRDFDINDDIPLHPCLKLLHICHQPLQLDLGRYIITMEKVTSYDVLMRELYGEVFWKSGQKLLIDLKGQLAENVRSRPNYDKIRVQRRRIRRKDFKGLRRSGFPL